MRFTIERIRTVVVAAGVLLLVALGVFLVRGAWKNPFKIDVPKRLGIDVQQQADSFTYTQSRGGRTLFKLHASKLVQLKNDHAMLHGVKIELYGTDGSRIDRIEGSEFEYDQKAQIAKAAGAVSITMMRPGAMPAVAADARAKTDKLKPPVGGGDLDGIGEAGEIHVTTSGLTFNQQTGIATTDQRVDFRVAQGTGSAIGATYASDQGHLVLDRQVELNMKRNGEPVQMLAQHAEFERGDMICHLRAASAAFRDGGASAGAATLTFRDDGTVVKMDASEGFALTTANGGHLAAPTGWLEFNERNQPQHGHLEGGVALDSSSETESKDRESHGTAPTAELEFSKDGELRHAHLERGVELTSVEHSAGRGGPVALNRKWRSPVADVEFRSAGSNPAKPGRKAAVSGQAGSAPQVEPAWMRGTGGVVVTSETRRGNGPPVPSRLAADDVKAEFASGSVLSALNGTGNASIDETTTSGAHQTSTGDRLEAHFAQPSSVGAAESKGKSQSAAQVESALIEGNVVMTQQPVQKAGAPPESPMRATAGRAEYEGVGEWLHLTMSPRVDDGGLQLSAEKIDVSQGSGDAFARGDVKATWISSADGRQAAGEPRQPQAGGPATAQASVGLGGSGPSHVIAAEAQMKQSTGEATFCGHARLWQDANSVSAPVIVLDRQKQTLNASSSDSAEPVRVVMVNTDAKVPGKETRNKPAKPSVVRISGTSLRYSDARHTAVMAAGAAGAVVTELAAAKTVSDEMELILLPPGNHAGKEGGSAQVDRMTATGHVVVSSGGRRGTGTKLVYTGETGEYVLTGTPGSPPKMTDPSRGTVTGEALIFHSGDDSVSIEGGGSKTATETRTPK